MVSVIICSVNDKLFTDVSQNISETIGIEYEIIKIENNVLQYNLTKALNYGAEQSKFQYLIFLHEDVKFHTINWGNPVVELLKNEETGIVGISGAVYKSGFPSTWSMVPSDLYRINAIQRWRNGTISNQIIKEGPECKFSPVVVTDGVFMSMRKIVWEDYKFDEVNILGFHFYDMDISLRIQTKYNNYVTHDLLLEHFSEGTITKTWIDESILFHRRFKKQLPVSLNPINKRSADYFACSAFVFTCIQLKYKFFLVLKYFIICLYLDFFNKTNINIFKAMILKLVKSTKSE